MVMNKVTRAGGTKRIGVAEAKAHLSEVLKSADSEPVVIHSRGRDVAVVLGMSTYERLLAAEANAPTDMQALMTDLAELRDRHGGAEIPYRRVQSMRRGSVRRRRK